VDKPGALARVADALAQHGVSIDQMRQYGTCDQSASVLIITHKSMRTALGAALDQLAGSDVLMDTPVALRIEHIT
jgi:homoserine dehydrogenase